MIISSLFIFGCVSDYSDGGSTIFSKTTTESYADGKTKSTTISAEVKQPDAPKNPATISFKDNPDGTVDVKTDTGESQDLGKIKSAMSAIGMLHPLVFAGAALCVLGILAAVIVRQYIWGAGLFFGGLAMSLGAVLIAQYAVYFGIIGVLALIWLLYTLYETKANKKANAENVKVVEKLKKELPEDKKRQLFNEKNGDISLIQSSSTKKLVKNIKKKLFNT